MILLPHFDKVLISSVCSPLIFPQTYYYSSRNIFQTLDVLREYETKQKNNQEYIEQDRLLMIRLGFVYSQSVHYIIYAMIERTHATI